MDACFLGDVYYYPCTLYIAETSSTNNKYRKEEEEE